MPTLFNSRQQQVTVQGVDVIIKPMSVLRGEEIRHVPETKERPGLYYVFECTFLPDGTRCFSSIQEVEALEVPTFDELYDIMANVNGWTTKATEEIKKN